MLAQLVFGVLREVQLALIGHLALSDSDDRIVVAEG